MVYGKHTKVLSKDKGKIVIELNERRIEIHENDEIIILSDVFYDDAEQDNKPDISKMDFDEFYWNIDGDDDGWDFINDLGYIHGLSVIHH